MSLALSRQGRISDEVRARVNSIADDLGYYRARKATRHGRLDSARVAILYSFDTHWAHSHRLLASIALAIDEVLYERGWYPSVVTFTRDMSAQDLFDRIAHARPAGLISVNFSNRTLFLRLEKSGVPVVLANNLEFQDIFCTVGVDDFQGTNEAAHYLLGLGHRRIAYFDYPQGTFHPMANRRFFGYKAAIEQAGVEFDETFRVEVDVHDLQRLVSSISELLSRPDPPTAFMSDDDNLMSSVWHAAETLGVRIPQDISAISHGDTLDYDRIDTPSLTTMRLSARQIGTFAAEMLVRRLKHELEEVQVVKLKEQMVDRGSCRRVASPGDAAIRRTP